jgi:hypothetical protein
MVVIHQFLGGTLPPNLDRLAVGRHLHRLSHFFNKSKFNAGDDETTTVEVNMPTSDAVLNDYLGSNNGAADEEGVAIANVGANSDSNIGAADEGAAIADVGANDYGNIGAADEGVANDNEEAQIDLQLNSTPIEVQEREAILLKATLHVKQAIIPRQQANNKIQQAIETADLPHENRRYCFITDYSQNMELPYFGASQPGDTYHFSALKINVFGIVDCSLFGGKLSAHVYHEGVGKKGGNNIASLLVNKLNRLNILQPDKTGKELTIIMDNCAGQNKIEWF